MEILLGITIVLLVVLFIPALIVRQGLRGELERLERMLQAQAAELSELRARMFESRTGQTGPVQREAPVQSEAPQVSPPPAAPVIWPAQGQPNPALSNATSNGTSNATRPDSFQPDPVQPNPIQPDPGQPPIILTRHEQAASAPRAASLLTPADTQAPAAGREPPARQGPPPSPPTPGWSPSPRTIFAAIGALLTLGGLAAVLTQLARAGVFTPELQLLLAALLGTGLYALSPRATGAVRGALQGLGYGILALCMGALHQVGVLPASAVLGLVLILSVLVGVHARRQERLLGMAVALTGATVSTWLLADDLEFGGLLLWAQSALFAVGLAAAAAASGNAALGSKEPPARLLVLALPAGIAGLLVVASEHNLRGAPLLWTALGLLMAGMVVRLSGVDARLGGVDARQSGNDQSAAPGVWSSILPLGLLVTTLLCAGPLAWAAQNGSVRPADPLAGYALLGLCAGLLTLAAWRIRGRGPSAPDPLREALVASATAAAGAWLGAALGTGAGTQRLIPLALALGLYGRWSASAPWRWGGALVAAALLVSSLGDLSPGQALLAASALGSALAIGGRSGSLVAAVAALVLTLWGAEQGLNVWIFTLATLLAVVTAVLLQGRLKSERALPLLLAALVALGSLDAVLLGRASPQSDVDVPVILASVLTSLVLGVVLRLGSAAPLLSRLLPAEFMGADDARERFGLRAQQVAEGLALLGGVTALSWLLDGQAQTAMLLSAVALSAPFLRGVIAWPLVSLPLLGLSLVASLSAPVTDLAAANGGSGGVALLSLLVASLALWLLGSLSGRRRLPLVPAARRDAAPLDAWALTLLEPGAACWGGLISVLASQFAARLADLAGTSGLLAPGALPTTLGLLGGGVVMLFQGRERRSVPVWWTGLGLFALASAKLVIADLDTLGTGGRGVALALVGLMLLGIAQLAPQARPEVEVSRPPESGV
ncbi:hypothetical protein [Deinococcus sp.]|uniref:hypothetical protein n=1 Tax=Deinococcus sp. TaxID=47478 RepID=UPI0025F8825A|nr:hypothetical protein [Deinococcus sp.]